MTMKSSCVRYQTISLAEQRNPLRKAQLEHQLIGNALRGWGTVPRDAGFPIVTPHTVEARVAPLITITPSDPPGKLFLSLQVWLPQVDSFDFQNWECFSAEDTGARLKH